jgi:hypothetical protein
MKKVLQRKFVLLFFQRILYLLLQVSLYFRSMKIYVPSSVFGLFVYVFCTVMYEPVEVFWGDRVINCVCLKFSEVWCMCVSMFCKVLCMGVYICGRYMFHTFFSSTGIKSWVLSMGRSVLPTFPYCLIGAFLLSDLRWSGSECVPVGSMVLRLQRC